jgi:biopolymer transport protein ExbD
MALKKRNKVSADFNMSSLTDIVFLLLIFFMLTSNVVNPTAINLMLPNSSRTNNSATAKPVVIKVDKSKVITFNKLKVDIPSLNGLLGQAIRIDGRPKDQISVVLDIHESVDAQTLVSIVDVINQYGVKMILATKVSEK